ncbi:MAG: PD-(D/E)XK nuclease family protein, partial [Sedimentibacter sp.]
IWIDGFESFTGQRQNLIKELIKCSVGVTLSLNIDALSLKELKNSQDWEAFKIVHDTYNFLTQGFEENVNIVSMKYNKCSDEIRAIEKNMFSINEEVFNKNTDDVQIYSSLNSYTETEKTASKIISLARDSGYRWKDIAVALGDMDSYGINIKKVFTQYEIPFFLDKKRDIVRNPLTKFVLSLLDMYVFNFKHDSVFEFLKTGFSSLNYDEVSKLENFALQYGIEGEKWFRPFKFNGKNIDYFNKLREKFAKDLNVPRKEFKQLNNANDITVFLFDFLNTFKVQEKIEKQVSVFKKSGMYEMSSENAQVWNYVIDILEQIILTGKDILLTPYEYKKMIEAGFREVKISIIPPTLDKVTVGEIDKISLKSFKAVFIMGANEGKLDSKKNEKGLLLHEERDFLSQVGIKILKNSEYYLYKEKHLLYKVFTSFTEKLFVSYALGTSDGKTLQKSMYVERLKQLFPLIKEESDLNVVSYISKVSNSKGTIDALISAMRDYTEGKNIDSVWKDVYSWYEKNDRAVLKIINQGLSYDNKAENITKENLEQIYQFPVTMSVSRLENFATCPFKFFMENIIEPQPRLVQKIEFYDL